MFWSDSGAYKWYTANMGIGSWAYIVVTSLLILAFSYFYNQLMFNPEDVSRQIQQNGGFIPGIRPGKPTTEYLKKVSRRMTFFGALFLAGLSLIPTLVFAAIAKGTGGGGTLVNAFSATGLLIIVNVALELHKQLEAQLQMKNYRGFLK
jgi:preprotein translocase subunit SecY